MTDTEFLNGFDIQYNNVTSNQAPGLNVHEICVFLTKAQDEVVKNYFNPKGNKYGEGFDGNQKRQIDFSMITKVKTISDSSAFGDALYDGRSNSSSVALPTDVMMVINERVEVTRNDQNDVGLVVRPIQFDEYDRLMSKPFKRPLRNQAWRLIVNDTANMADLIVGPGDEITKYSIRYIKRPRPIIVGDLDGLTIDGYEYGTYALEEPSSQTTPPTGPTYTSGCELDPILHEEILQRAVELAKVAWTATGGDNTEAVLTAGQRSE